MWWQVELGPNNFVHYPLLAYRDFSRFVGTLFDKAPGHILNLQLDEDTVAELPSKSFGPPISHQM